MATMFGHSGQCVRVCICIHINIGIYIYIVVLVFLVSKVYDGPVFSLLLTHLGCCGPTVCAVFVCVCLRDCNWIEVQQRLQTPDHSLWGQVRHTFMTSLICFVGHFQP